MNNVSAMMSKIEIHGHRWQEEREWLESDAWIGERG
jgi:hypothetical protein